MKNSNFTKIIAVFASIVLLVGVFAAVTAMADAEAATPVYTDEVGIISMNVSYQARTELAFAVKDGGAISDGAKSREVYLLFFNSNPDENGDLSGKELYQNASYRKSSAGKVNVQGESALLFYSNGILARDLDKDIYVCPVVVERFEDGTVEYTRGYTTKGVDGAEAAYSSRACSVVSYARQQIQFKESFGAGELELYSNILFYSAAIANKEGVSAADGGWFIVNGGSIGKSSDGNNQYKIDASEYAADETVLIRALPNYNGQYFLYWKDVYGNVVSTDRLYDAPTHNDIGLAIYTSVYGTAEQSAYCSVLDFDDIEAGNLVPFDMPEALPSSGYENYTATVGNFAYADRVFFQSSESGALEVLASTSPKITNNNGDGELVLSKNHTKFSPMQTLTPDVGLNSRSLEFDLKVSDLQSDKTNIRFIVYSDGNSADVQFTMVMHFYKGENGAYNVYVGSRQGSGKYLFNRSTENATYAPLLCNMTASFPTADVKSYAATEGEILNVKYVIDDSAAAPVARVYINGELMFIGSGAAINTYSNGYFEASAGYAAGIAAINKVTVQCDTKFNGTVTLDNIAFIK